MWAGGRGRGSQQVLPAAGECVRGGEPLHETERDYPRHSRHRSGITEIANAITADRGVLAPASRIGHHTPVLMRSGQCPIPVVLGRRFRYRSATADRDIAHAEHQTIDSSRVGAARDDFEFRRRHRIARSRGAILVPRRADTGCTRAHCATPHVATPQVRTYAAIALIRRERAWENSRFYVLVALLVFTVGRPPRRIRR